MKVVIIGTGMAGLTAGAYLVREGYEVTLFEQFEHIGGVTATIHQDGYAWDLGPMLVEGLSSHEKLGRILTELGLDNKLTLIRDERNQSFIDFELRSPEEYQGPYWRRERLKELFPEDSVGLDEYYEFHDIIMKLLYFGNQIPFSKGFKKLKYKLKLLFNFLKVKKYKDWSAAQLTEHFFSNQKLRTVFLGILADMVVKPSEFSAFGVPVFNPECVFDKRVPIDRGSYKMPTYKYIKNGCGELVKILADYITENGGTIFTKKMVTKILVEDGRAYGVKFEDGKILEADIVLTSGGMFKTFYDVIGKEHLTEEFIHHIENLTLMESVLMVHIGVDFDPTPYQDIPLIYYYRTYDIEGAIEKMRNGIFHEGKDGFLIYILSMHSPEMAPPGRHAITVYTVAPYELKNGDWTTQREELADKLLIEAEKIIPGLREHTKTRVIITPHDFQSRLNISRHSFGGIAPTLTQSNLPYQTPVENLWYIGQFSASGAGVFGTAAGGRDVAEMIIKKGDEPKFTDLHDKGGDRAHHF
ncbi:MAG: FAD-dependent oxidoreductase [Candidatus Lokiarchaeota archaeon]|nr:FAD-dependent oxidoreductase [Candidatus Lokiarchaeota archaeon]MBD3342660.1 FAD-dependent oxidoreductase [Candidatus Lokiarchaeota archaeon]